MAKYMIKFLKVDEEVRKSIKLPKQAVEILAWAETEYGENAVDQRDLFETLDSHLTDNKVLSVSPKQPISRIFQFYRKRLADEGLIEIEKEASPEKPAKEPKAPKEASTGKSRRRKDDAISETAADGAQDVL
jgi:hypothetical protein